MPQYIVKLHDDKLDRDWYIEWSTIVDAPVTYGMSLEEFREHYQQEYGNSSMGILEERLARVSENGTSSGFRHTPDDLLRTNRAGPDELFADKETILDYYCRNQPAETQ